MGDIASELLTALESNPDPRVKALADRERLRLSDPMSRLAQSVGGVPKEKVTTPLGPTAKSALPYGQDLAPEEWLKKLGGGDEQLLEALRAMVKSSSAGGGGGVDLSEYRKAIADDEAKRADFMANLNAKRGALQAAIAARGIPEVFDGRRVDEELRKATPDVRPDNSGFLWGQSMKGWYDPKRGIVASQDIVPAARLVAEINSKAGDDYEKRIAQQLGLGREAILGRNTQRAAEDRNVEDALSVTMPGKVDLDLLNQGAKAQGALSMAGLKAQASANNAMAKLAAKQSPEAMLLRAHELKALGEKTKNPMLVELGKSLLKNLHGDVKEHKFDEKETNFYKAELERSMGKASPEQQKLILDAYARVLEDGGTPQQAASAARTLMQPK